MSESINNLIAAPETPVTKPDYMVYPDWLLIENKTYVALFENIVALRHYYTMFFTTQNPECQKDLSKQFMQRLTHVMNDVGNQYDYSASALEFTKGQIDNINLQWLTHIDPLVSLMAAVDFGLHAEVEEGKPPVIRGGLDLRDMLKGELPEDFLYKHSATQGAFNSFAFALWVQKRTSV